MPDNRGWNGHNKGQININHVKHTNIHFQATVFCGHEANLQVFVLFTSLHLACKITLVHFLATTSFRTAQSSLLFSNALHGVSVMSSAETFAGAAGVEIVGDVRVCSAKMTTVCLCRCRNSYTGRPGRRRRLGFNSSRWQTASTFRWRLYFSPLKLTQHWWSVYLVINTATCLQYQFGTRSAEY